MNNIFTIAEIGCNHKGDMSIAHEMIKIAANFCNADIIKFQKRTVKELLTPEEYNAPHPNPENSYGRTYGEHRDFLEFNIDQHRQLKEWCEEEGAIYSTSVWDITAAKEIIQLNPKLIKIPSASNYNYKLLDLISRDFKGEIHISLGMTTKEEEYNIFKFFDDRKRLNDLVLYHCISGYPVSFEDLSLLEIKRLKDSYGNCVKAIGFSGHHLGIAADIAALTLGATFFERHFTLDRTWKGTDHAASLEPDGLRKLVRDLNNVNVALSYKKTEILEVEKVQRKKLKRGVKDL